MKIMKMSKGFSVVVIFLVAASTLWGVGGQEEAAVSADGLPQSGGTVNWLSWAAAMGRTIGGWDGREAGAWTAMHVNDPYLEHLLIMDLDRGPRGTNEIPFDQPEPIYDLQFYKGQLLERWEATPQKLVFYVRRGVYWTGNDRLKVAPREFVAEDIKYGLEGLEGFPYKYAPVERWLGKITVLDKYTLEIAFKQPELIPCGAFQLNNKVP